MQLTDLFSRPETRNEPELLDAHRAAFAALTIMIPIGLIALVAAMFFTSDKAEAAGEIRGLGMVMVPGMGMFVALLRKRIKNADPFAVPKSVLMIRYIFAVTAPYWISSIILNQHDSILTGIAALVFEIANDWSHSKKFKENRLINGVRNAAE